MCVGWATKSSTQNIWFASLMTVSDVRSHWKMQMSWWKVDFQVPTYPTRQVRVESKILPAPCDAQCCLGCYCWWCVCSFNHRNISTLSFPFCASSVKVRSEKQTNKQTKKTPRRPFFHCLLKKTEEKTRQQPNRRYSPPAKVSNSRTRDANILMTWWWCSSWWRKPGSWKLPKRNVVDGMLHQISTRNLDGANFNFKFWWCS